MIETTYCVMETKTGVILVEGSYQFCKQWVSEHCKYIDKYDFWKDADHEIVTITVI